MYAVLFRENRFFVTLLAVFLAGMVARRTQMSLHGPYWSFFALAVVYAILCYVACALLTGYYLNKRAGGIDTREIAPGMQAWESTAGTGVVPRWVSFIGIGSIYFLLAIPFELVASVFR